MRIILAAISGLVFGIGLIAGGMTDPHKIRAFLDVSGRWDPSLAFVMVGAIALGVAAFARARRQPQAWSGAPLELPVSTAVDVRLVVGGILFGIGWGWAGFCPGPAWVAMASGSGAALIFVAAMLVGMTLHDRGWAVLGAATGAATAGASAADQ